LFWSYRRELANLSHHVSNASNLVLVFWAERLEVRAHATIQRSRRGSIIEARSELKFARWQVPPVEDGGHQLCVQVAILEIRWNIVPGW